MYLTFTKKSSINVTVIKGNTSSNSMNSTREGSKAYSTVNLGFLGGWKFYFADLITAAA